MKKRISIADIAKELNVSKTTVSFVLNGKAKENYISDALAERVIKYVEEVGYKPNDLARGLRTGKTKIIGMLVEEISDAFFSSIARIIEESAYKKGYKIFYSSTENNPEKTKELINVFRSRQVDGYIIAPTPGIEEDIKALLNDNLPVVLFDRYFPELPTDTVIVENFESSFNAIKHLVKNGFKSIAFITLVSDQVQMEDRLNGYLQAIEESNLKPTVKAVSFENEPEENISEIKRFLEQQTNLDALFFSTNYLAENGLEAIRALNLRIPEDLGIVVFDDSNLFRLFSPPITAIAQPIKELSEAIIDLLLRRLTENDKTPEKKMIVLPATLVERKSSGPVSKEPDPVGKRKNKKPV
jgi:LacI family transcriptional regulator